MFVRDGFYSFHQQQANFVCTLFFSTDKSSAVKRDGDLETLSVGKILAGRITAALLQRNKRIVLWRKAGSSSSSSSGSWVADKEVSPGNHGTLLEELGQYLSKTLDASASMIAAVHKSSGRVGVACANAQLGKLVLFEFADDADGSVLESVLVQQGVREVLVAAAATPSDGPPAKKRTKTSFAAPSLGPTSSPAAAYDGFMRHAFLRAAVAVTLLPSESFIPAPAEELMASLTSILLKSNDDGGVGPYDLDLANAKNMRNVHPAIAALFAHLELGNSASARGYTLELGLPEEVLCYDASVSHALSVFPENGGGGGSGRAFDLSELGDKGDGAEDEAGAAEEESEETGKGKGRQQQPPSHTLFALLNHCKTKMGSRLLRQWMQQPLRNPDRIKTRLDDVAALLEAVVVRNSLRDGSAYLLRCPDLEKTAHKFRNRGASRASLLDMLTVYRAALRLQACSALAKDRWIPSSSSSSSATAPVVLLGMEACSKDLSKFMALVEELVDSESLKASSSGRRSEGSLWGNKWVQVRPSMSPELEKLATQLSILRGEILVEHKRAAQVAGVDLKQMHLERSAVHGLHLRVTKKDATKALKALDKEGCKTLSLQKMGTLFLTAKLGRLVASHEETRKRFEEEQAGIVRKAVEVAATYFPVMQRASALVAELDCLCCLAHVAATNDWVRPTILSPTSAGTGAVTDDGGLYLVGLRHPIVEALVGRSKYIASDLDFRSGKRTAIITGPNMGGKSTYIRAVGLAVLLSHMGSFVPCTSASIPCYDRLLARVGASDSTMAGLSTFMAECVDVAKILKRASRDSLVIADELGRGTSSHDGFGIAWAVIERLATQTKATSLFATHFHELNDLATLHPSDVVSLHVSAHVDDVGKVTMLFNVEPGIAERSYGVACARLAHFPADVLEEATTLVESLEKKQ